MAANNVNNKKQENQEILQKLKQRRILPSDTQNVTIRELIDIAKKRGMGSYSKKSKKDLADFIIINSPEPVSEIRESKSALRGFTKQYVIDGYKYNKYY